MAIWLSQELAASDRHGRQAYWRACIAALLGEADRAVGLLRDAFAAGHPAFIEPGANG
jgi:hypothetical protein